MSTFPAATAPIATRLAAIVGADHVRNPVGPEARAASVIAEPADAVQVAAIVDYGEAAGITLAALGTGRTLAQIRPAPVAIGIAFARMDRIIACEPDDMTVVAESGLTVAALNQHLATCRQRLPADPVRPDLTTLGALVAAAHGGPLRLSEGTVRDRLIGIRFVGHGGRIVHGGGRVVKNVAGYDLMKVMTGSFGTLGLITEVTLRVSPLPEHYTLALRGFGDAPAAFATAARLRDALPLAHLEILSPVLAAELGCSSYLLVAGFSGGSDEREYLESTALPILGTGTEYLRDDDAVSIYQRLRDSAPAAALVAQLAVLPGALADCVVKCAVEFRAHAGNGIAQLFLAGPNPAEELRATVTGWRTIAHAAQGHVRVLAVTDAGREGLDLFDQPPAAALKLMRRLKTAFDPQGVFNPGGFVAGL